MPTDAQNDALATREGKHSPLPWTIGDAGSTTEGHIVSRRDGHSIVVADMCGSWDEPDVRADAGLLLRAVNAHSDLVNAADMAINVLIGCTVSAGGCDDARHIQEAKTALRAALAKASP